METKCMNYECLYTRPRSLPLFTFQVLILHWRSLESGDSWYRSRQLKTTIWSHYIDDCLMYAGSEPSRAATVLCVAIKCLISLTLLYVVMTVWKTEDPRLKEHDDCLIYSWLSCIFTMTVLCIHDCLMYSWWLSYILMTVLYVLVVSLRAQLAGLVPEDPRRKEHDDCFMYS
jgi:hypothetical protein